MQTIFFYGTLLSCLRIKTNLFSVEQEKELIFLGNGSISGKLYDNGEYPCFIFLKNHAKVRGEIYKIKKSSFILPLLDNYEDFFPDNFPKSLFIRRERPVFFEKKFIFSGVYEWNRPVGTLQEIKSGNYLNFLKQKSL